MKHRLELIGSGALLALLFFCSTGVAQSGFPTVAPELPRQGGTASPALFNAQVSTGIAASPFRGSVVTSSATSEDLALSLQDALAKGLKSNLGLLLSSESRSASEGERWKALSGLLPLVDAHTAAAVQQTNLAAFGFPPFPGVPQIVGPFSVFDARARVSAPVVDFSAMRRLGAASAKRDAATFTYRDARDTVAALVANLYFLALSGASRVEAVQSQVKTAEALYSRAVDLKNSGVVAGIETLRAQVELQSQRQRLIFFQNQSEKQKLDLARAIGLPTGQTFHLTDVLADSPAPVLGLEDALGRAYETRSDYQSLLASVRAAEAERKAAVAERYPTLNFDGDYGAIGRTPASSHGTFTAAGSLRIPIFQGGRVRGEIMESGAELAQQKAQLEDLHSGIEYEIRVAMMDLQSSHDQVAVAQSGLNLARQQMEQAQDRFTAGVVNNIEVVQAQEALATADENYINALYSYAVAKTALARAVGAAEEGLQQFLRGGPQ